MFIDKSYNIYHMPCGDLCATTCLEQVEEQPTYTVRKRGKRQVTRRGRIVYVFFFVERGLTRERANLDISLCGHSTQKPLTPGNLNVKGLPGDKFWTRRSQNWNFGTGRDAF